MPTLPNILVRQAMVPANIEKGMPALPKLSQALSQLAVALPAGPMLPEVPVVAEAVPTAEPFAQVIRGFEDVLPEGAPKLSEGIQAFAMGGYRPVEKEKPPKVAYRVMGSGYRSIS